MIDPNQISGCLLGGAIGDALGAPIEFHDIHTIRRQYGEEGIISYVELNPQGEAEFTDDTQMTLFTAEGLLVAAARGESDAEQMEAVHRAYLRWLKTQLKEFSTSEAAHHEGRLLAYPSLWKRRAPGNTCLSALRSGKMGTLQQKINDSKGCGGIMRAAPAGIVARGAEAFTLGCGAAAITHGHPSGYLSAGCLAEIISNVLAGDSPLDAIAPLEERLKQFPDHEETLNALKTAVALAQDAEIIPSPETLQGMGGAWVGEEALAISVYCFLKAAQMEDRAKAFRDGVLLAVNHSGDCDSTGAIAGNLLGAWLGRQSIPPEWLAALEMRREIEIVATDLWVATDHPQVLAEKYL